MSVKETFTLFVNSLTTPTTVAGATFTNRTYSINWTTVIPTKYKNRKFLVGSNFVSNVLSNDTTLASGTISCNLGTSNMSDGSNRSNVISLFYQQTQICNNTNQVAQNYMSLPVNNLPITIRYPADNSLLVTVANWNNSAFSANFTSYMLILSFTLVDEEEHSNNAENNSHGEYNSLLTLSKQKM